MSVANEDNQRSENIPTKKQGRADFDYDSDGIEVESPEPKRARVDSPEPACGIAGVFPVAEDIDQMLGYYSDLASQELESVIKGLKEEEILPPPTPGTVVAAAVEAEDEARRELGFLLEASDDELGLPPAPATPDRARTAAAHFDEILNLEEFIEELSAFGMAAGGDLPFEYDGEKETEPVDMSLWRQDSLPAASLTL